MSLDESEQKIDVREGIVHSSIPADELARLSDDVISALKTVYDPEIPADIFELGLIYKIDIEDDRMVKIMMTLTAPGCPVLKRDARLGRKRRRRRRRRIRRRGGHGLRSAVDAGSHVRRGASRRRLVLRSRGIDPFTSGYYI